jgi:hypothetical protein
VTDLQRVSFLGRPDFDSTVVYQRYYLLGLEAVASVDFHGAPIAVRHVRGAAAKAQAIRRLRQHPALRAVFGPGVPDSGMVGRYVSDTGIRFAIDARDNHRLLEKDAEAYTWADVYLKANHRPTEDYPPHVKPIVNGNGLLDARSIEFLRSRRETPKDLDVVFVSNIWGGREHNVHLFEELARHDGPKRLLAVFPAGGNAAADAVLMRRLDAAGVPWTHDPLPPQELWRLLSRARVVPFRSGRHLCIPWRMLDLLALGACVLFDAPPLPQWPVPLESGVHYVDLGLTRAERPDPEQYAIVRPTLATLLADDARQHELRRAAARYYDDHAAPQRVGTYIARTLKGEQ